MEPPSDFLLNVVKMPNGEDAFEYSDVLFAPHAIVELDNGRLLLEIPKDEIDRVILKYGFTALHPILEGVFGGILLAVGIIPIVLSAAVAAMRPRMAKLVIYLLGAGLVGLFVLHSAIRRGYFLEIWTVRGRKKIVFGKKASTDELAHTLHIVNESFGYEITSDLP